MGQNVLPEFLHRLLDDTYRLVLLLMPVRENQSVDLRNAICTYEVAMEGLKVAIGRNLECTPQPAAAPTAKCKICHIAIYHEAAASGYCSAHEPPPAKHNAVCLDPGGFCIQCMQAYEGMECPRCYMVRNIKKTAEMELGQAHV